MLDFLAAFIKKYTGVDNVGNTKDNRGECVGLVSMYMDALGVPHVWGHGKDLYANSPESHFKKILNTPNFLPIAGDIGVWGGGTYGHTGIFLRGNLKDFISFDANYPVGSKPHEQFHTYENVTGWLRPLNVPGSDEPNDCEKDLVAAKAKLSLKGREITKLERALNLTNKNFGVLETQYKLSVGTVNIQKTEIGELGLEVTRLQAQKFELSELISFFMIWLQTGGDSRNT